MCGIVGYAGNVRTACGKPLEVCLQGLQRLEYRGYDSAGVALTAPGMERVAVRKKAGRLANLVQDIERDPMPDATVGIGHTRWATNGVPNDTNAHPHTSRDGKVATTASSKTLPSFVSTCRRRAIVSSPKPIPRSRRSCWAKSATRSSRKPVSLTCSRPSAVWPACWKARSPFSPRTCASRTSWSAPVTIRRWWSVLAKARTSSAPTWPRSWPTPSAPWKSTRTRP